MARITSHFYFWIGVLGSKLFRNNQPSLGSGNRNLVSRFPTLFALEAADRIRSQLSFLGIEPQRMPVNFQDRILLLVGPVGNRDERLSVLLIYRR